MREDQINPQDRKFIREMLASWFVAVFFFAMAVLLISLHEKRPMDRTLLRWYEPPVAGHEAWDVKESPRPGAHLFIPQSGSSAAPLLLPDGAGVEE